MHILFTVRIGTLSVDGACLANSFLGVTAAVYLEVIEEQLPTLWESGLIFYARQCLNPHSSHNQEIGLLTLELM
jgi:hypothetical protein